MDNIEGSLRISRISRQTEPEPWTYEISFAPYDASDIPPACDVFGELQLERALRPGLGMAEGRLRESVQKARQGAVVVHHVRLSDDMLRSIFHEEPLTSG